jgi:hypothetical protein
LKNSALERGRGRGRGREREREREREGGREGGGRERERSDVKNEGKYKISAICNEGGVRFDNLCGSPFVQQQAEIVVT